MKKGGFFIFALLVVLMIPLNVQVSLGQDNDLAEETSAQVPAGKEGIQDPITPESDIQWLWGEVSSVDPQKNEIGVKYLDYETDTEKEIKITTDDKTTYEGANAISDIKLSEIISVDYTFSPDGKHIAKYISIEKLDEKQELQKKVTGEVQNLTTESEKALP